MKLSTSLITFARRSAGVVVRLLFVAQPAVLWADAKESENNVSSPLQRLHHIIVIYQENWSFDSLYGQFPGANAYAYGFDTSPQVDLKASPAYSTLIYKSPSPLNRGVTDPQFPTSLDGSLGLWSNHNVAFPLIPYDFTNYIDRNVKTGDIIHRFYHEQLQIDNGALEPSLATWTSL